MNFGVGCLTFLLGLLCFPFFLAGWCWGLARAVFLFGMADGDETARSL